MPHLSGMLFSEDQSVREIASMKVELFGVETPFQLPPPMSLSCLVSEGGYVHKDDLF